VWFQAVMALLPRFLISQSEELADLFQNLAI
jgi:hypothetical protein